MRYRKIAVLFAGALFFILSAPVYSQTEIKNTFTVRASAETVVPLLGDSEIFNLGFGGNISAEYFILPFLGPSLFAGMDIMPVRGLEPLTLMRGGAGAGFRLRPADRLSFRADVYGGLYTSRWRGDSSSGLLWGVRGEAGIRITPALTLSLHAGFADYMSSPEPLLRAFTGGISMTVNIGEIGNRDPQLEIEPKDLTPIFPVFYSYYDDNSFGSVEVQNREEADIKNVTVSLFIPEYMSRPRECGSFHRIAENQDVSVPLYALFNDEVLELTENTKAQAEIQVEYRLLGKKMEANVPLELTMYHRNAMTWEDDKKAAAFVSPTDPAVLWFSRFAAGIVRDRLRNDIHKDLQYAMGLFEAMKLYGINYVIDPNSSYVEKSAAETAIDYLQFPHQTLFYRGGDCDDLSILYSALLESMGIETAFITIPGHIYMSLRLKISEAEARNLFFDPSMLIFHDENVWLPVEITMVKEGFVKAWRIGAKEWNDNVKTGSAALYPTRDCWIAYKPAGIPNVNPRFSLPDETAIVESFDTSMNRYVAREILPAVEQFKRNPMGTSEEQNNALGVLFAKYAMLDEAWREFSAAAKAGYPRAWANLGNVAFLQRDYELALKYYKWALKLDPDDTISLLGLARCYYELENLSESEAAYARLQEKDPELASRYGYLASVLGGEGRAWSFTERLTTTVWAESPRVRMAQHETHLAMGLPEAEIDEDEIPPQEPSVEPESEAVTTGESASESGTVEDTAAEEAEQPEEESAPAEEETPIEPEQKPKLAEKPDEAEAGADEPTADTVAEPAAAAKAENAGTEPPAASETARADETAEADAETKPSDPQEEEQAPDTPEAPEIAEAPPEDPVTKAAEEERRPAVEDEPSPEQEPRQDGREEIREAPEDEAPPPIAEAPPEDPEVAVKRRPEQRSEEEQQPETERQPTEAEGPASSVPGRAEREEPDTAGRDTDKPAETAEAAAPSTGTGRAEASEPQPERAVAAAPDENTEEAPEKADAPAEDSSEKPGAEIVLDDFNAAKKALGSWSVEPDRAVQKDPKQLFAKLVVPLHQGKSRMRYSFTARSTGSGWTGLGIHIYRGPAATHRGYGAGKSILIWVTSDPKHYNNDDTRLELYRSLDDINMYRLNSIVISESIYDANKYAVEIDTNSGTVTVQVNGAERLKASGFSDFSEGEFIVLRSLDTAEFRNIKVEELR
jgi:tetratricopeptide (TPR) repeat protein